MRFYEICGLFAQIGFCVTFAVNFFFIYVTWRHVKQLAGTYKLMIIFFSLLGVMYSGWECVTRPVMHNYNQGLIYFSISTWDLPKAFFQLAMAIHSAFYGVIFSFIAVLFTFRYVSLVRPMFLTNLDGKSSVLWFLYSIIIGFLFGVSLWFLVSPDEYADAYMGDELYEKYELNISQVAHFMVVAYDENHHVRWRNMYFLGASCVLLGIQYLLIIFCAVQIQRTLKRELKNTPFPRQQLQRQLFVALVIQTVFPTILYMLPVAFILFLPLFDLKLSLETQVIYAVISLYPPLDSIAFMMIVAEYRKIMRDTFHLPCFKHSISDYRSKEIVTNSQMRNVSF